MSRRGTPFLRTQSNGEMLLVVLVVVVVVVGVADKLPTTILRLVLALAQRKNERKEMSQTKTMT